jgi:hypothetical protein
MMIKKLTIGLVLLSIVLLWSGTAFSSEPLPEEFNVLVRESLGRRGQMMILDEAGQGKVNRIGSILIHAPLERVWEVLTDFESWPGFVPMMTRARIVRREESTVTVDFMLTTRFLMIPFRHSYTTVFKLEKPKILIFNEKLEETGFYKLFPVGGKTLLIVSEEAPSLEEMGGLVATIVRGIPGAELALTLSPPFVLFDAIRKRAEGNW